MLRSSSSIGVHCIQSPSHDRHIQNRLSTHVFAVFALTLSFAWFPTNRFVSVNETKEAIERSLNAFSRTLTWSLYQMETRLSV